MIGLVFSSFPWVLIPVFLVNAQPQLNTCRPGWLYVNNKCWLYDPVPRSWQEARSACQSKRAELGSIHNEEENRFIHTLIQLQRLGLQVPASLRGPVVIAGGRRKRQLPVGGVLPEFQRTDNALLVGSAEVALDASEVGCQQECLRSRRTYNFNCLSLMYYLDSRDCILNSQSRTTTPDLFTRETFGERINYYELQRSQPRPTTPRDPCFPGIPNALLSGSAEIATRTANVRECWARCTSAMEEFSFRCRSLLWYRDTNDCILNSENRITNPLLFTRNTVGERVDYYDNICDPPADCEVSQWSIWSQCTASCGGGSITRTRRVIKGQSGTGRACPSLSDTQICNTVSCAVDCQVGQWSQWSPCSKTCGGGTRSRTRRILTQSIGPGRRCPGLNDVGTCATGPCTIEICHAQFVDLLMIVDGSGSIGGPNFAKMKDFLQLIVDATEIGPFKTHVGAVQFNNFTYTEFALNTYAKKEDVKAAINRLVWRQGATLIGDAMSFAQKNELQPWRGDRPNIPTIVLVVTDGFSQDDPGPPARRMRERGFITVALGISQATEDGQLLKIAGSPERVFKVQNFSSLDIRLKDSIAAQVCSEVPVAPSPAPDRAVQGAWIGLKTNSFGNNYQWSDGSFLNYQNWYPGQPSRNMAGERCVVTEYEVQQRWSVRSCVERMPSVCSMPPSVVIGPP